MESTESTESTEATEARQSLSIEDLKEQGNLAFKRAALLRRTTAASQYLSEAKSYYIEAIQRLGSAKADSANLALTCVLHSNLAAVYLQEVPPKWTEAKAAADIALTVDQQNVKARFRRAQALLQDNREGLPIKALKEALDDLKAAQTLEPRNSQVRDEAKRVSQRLDRLEQKQQVPIARKIVEKHVAAALLDRGSDCLDSHGYVWGQSNHIVRVFVPVQGSRLATRSQVECKILTNKLQLKLLDAESHVMFEVDACLHKAVRADESSWQMEEGGLLLIVELVKRDTSEDSEHWSRVWQGHPATKAPTAKEQEYLHEVARAACHANSEEEPKTDPAKLQRWKEALPGIDVQWGDTSIEALRAELDMAEIKVGHPNSTRAQLPLLKK